MFISIIISQLVGYYRPTRVEIYATRLDGYTPHQSYSLAVVGTKAGAGLTPCQRVKSRDGMDCLEVTLHPESGMNAV